jgi:hypothetical protein
MNNRAQWLSAWLVGVFVLAFPSFWGVWAQEAPLYGGPHISNPAPPEVSERQMRIHEEYCRTHPDACVMGFTYTPEGLKQLGESIRDRGPYVPPNPKNTAAIVTTTCRPDPNNPEGPEICMECRANPPNPTQPLCVQQIPGHSVNIPQLPASASRNENNEGR